MRKTVIRILFCFLVVTLAACKKETPAPTPLTTSVKNSISYAKGLELYHYATFSIVKITSPWPDAKKEYTYVLHKAGTVIPDSLKSATAIQVPVKSLVATSTTHIPSLEMLGVENTLVGFPNTDYISSEKTRKRIDSGKVKEVGNNESLNTEVLIDLDPDVIVGYGIDNNNPSLDILEKSGLKVILNGDWNEQTPLGKAEWIKFFGALYDKDDEAATLFSGIEKEYLATVALAKKAVTQPTVFTGAMYQDQWYMSEGNSWAATFLKDANVTYLWKDTPGTGSLALSFETVFLKAQNAEFWIGPAQFTALREMADANPHYAQFDAFKNKKVYSSSTKKGAKGGVLYYEIAPNRPDLVLKDMIKILHPELLPDYELYFFEKLN